jgi:uncharacterized cupin superfamily protein
LAPVHLHSREDEFSFVLEGPLGFLQADDVVVNEPRDPVYTPRDVWHTFWNATDANPVRVSEVHREITAE